MGSGGAGHSGGRPSMAGGGRNMIPNRGSNTARGIYVTRANGGLYQPGYSHFYNNYSGWLNGYWNGWYIRPWLWGGGGLGAGWLLSSAYANYFNPYYSADLMPFYDYGVPLAVYDPTLLDPYAADDGMMGYYTIDPQRDADLTNPDVVAATQLSEQARAGIPRTGLRKSSSTDRQGRKVIAERSHSPRIPGTGSVCSAQIPGGNSNDL